MNFIPGPPDVPAIPASPNDPIPYFMENTFPGGFQAKYCCFIPCLPGFYLWSRSIEDKSTQSSCKYQLMAYNDGNGRIKLHTSTLTVSSGNSRLSNSSAHDVLDSPITTLECWEALTGQRIALNVEEIIP